MRWVASAGGTRNLSDADRVSLTAAHRYIFGQETPLDIDRLPRALPNVLAKGLGTGTLSEHALRLIAVMALVDGTVDAAKIDVVTSYAVALGVHSEYLTDLTEAAAGHLRWAGMDMVRHNMLSITGQPWAKGDVMPWLLPYQGDNADPELSSRFQALRELPEDTLGHAFWDWYTRHRFAFPGEPGALNQAFAVPHDTTHLLSGYSTTYRGEILVSTFTAGMHPEEPMAGHILPVIFSWHLDIELIESAGSHQGGLDPAAFWQAWARGSEMGRDVFAHDWKFWQHALTPLAELRARYRVPPLESK
jgi:hypothetical protein